VAVLVLVFAVVLPRAMVRADEGGSHGDNNCGGVTGDSNGSGSGLMIAGKKKHVKQCD
jgi:hypothetical protein